MEILKVENLTKIYGKDIFQFDDDKLAIFRRRQEFAMLKSIGMTSKEFSRMIR